MEIANIQQLINPYINLPLECDGLTRVISYILNKNGIEHKVMIGDIGTIHLWIELDDYIIDYKARSVAGHYPRTTPPSLPLVRGGTSHMRWFLPLTKGEIKRG